MIDYSIIIRTTGKANEKYQGLLDSIKIQPQPKEIIVVLPEGNPYPKEKLGSETYYFCQKGMIIQRMTGIEKCTTQYALICDDDVQFEANFVEKLYEPIKLGMCSMTAGPLYSFLPPQGMNALICTIVASALPTFFHKNQYVTVLRTTGYSYNRKLKDVKKYYETQSVAWTCFFADVDALKTIEFNDEIWLDKHGYSALDDQTMFYKAYLRNVKTMVVVDANYKHLDAKTSMRNNRKPVIYSLNFNRIVFWHRFIYTQQKNRIFKLYSVVCFFYRLLWDLLFDSLNIMRKRITVDDFQICCKGRSDAWKYLKTSEYKKMPPVR